MAISLKVSFLIPLVVSFGAVISGAVDPFYWHHDCPNKTTFVRNSTFQSNLNSLLSSLSSNATRTTNNGFYNTTAGQSPNTVYGLFLCRGDLSPKVCRDCVAFATRDIVSRCPVGKVAVIWYDECLLRYSNRTILSTGERSPNITLINTQEMPDFFFLGKVIEVLNYTINEAANARWDAQKFATKVENLTSTQTVYCLVQCTPDLSAEDCNTCLRGAVAYLPSCCLGQRGVRILTPSCNFRYELYPFFNHTAGAPPPTSPLLRQPLPPPKGKRKLSAAVLIIAIVAPISVAVLLFILGCCFVSRRARDNMTTTLQEETGIIDKPKLMSAG